MPPEHVKDLWRTWEDLRRTADPQRRMELGRRIVRNQAENLWGIGTVGGAIKPVVVSHRLNNVTGTEENGLWGWPWLATFLHHPEQFFIKE